MATKKRSASGGAKKKPTTVNTEDFDKESALQVAKLAFEELPHCNKVFIDSDLNYHTFKKANCIEITREMVDGDEPQEEPEAAVSNGGDPNA